MHAQSLSMQDCGKVKNGCPGIESATFGDRPRANEVRTASTVGIGIRLGLVAIASLMIACRSYDFRRSTLVTPRSVQILQTVPQILPVLVRKGYINKFVQNWKEIGKTVDGAWGGRVKRSVVLSAQAKE